MYKDDTGKFDDSRMSRILAELSHALGQVDRETLKAWGARSGRRLAGLFFRRIGAFARLAGKLAYSGFKEGRDLAEAIHVGRGVEQVGDRSAAAIDSSIAFVRDGKLAMCRIRNALQDDPRRNIPRLAAGVLGFYAGSGGLDGNGGIPDLDLMAGIGFHRSLLTHSILAGVMAEGLLIALMDLSGEIKDSLPEEHDPFWDKMAEMASPLAGPLATGTSAGIAYHLIVDATLQPAAYHGLPWQMPLEGHELALGANGAAEGAYAADFGNKTAPPSNKADQGASAHPTAGRRVVEGIAQAASNAGDFGRRWLGRFGYR
jgi:hypothetical protein